MTRAVAPAAAMFTGASGNTLAGDVYGEEGAPVLLLHGGGQTRHAWKKTGELIARMGRVAYAVDQRGHGDSEWVKDGAYQYEDFAADARVLADTLAQRSGIGERSDAVLRKDMRPVAVGASLGGMAALLANGGGQGEVFSALVLVDITPRIDSDGVARIQGFMRAQIREGFGSIAEAADAVAAYLPHRPRPRSHEGLKKNLRLHPDGRWRWHWDPKFLEGNRRIGAGSEEVERKLVEAARATTIPALLVRGASSELVGEEHAKDFLELVPHARYVDVSGARHMVAGDRNDQFANAIQKFLYELKYTS
jgi:pimeloyl-ACP methyl ester carboxylesterase